MACFLFGIFSRNVDLFRVHLVNPPLDGVKKGSQ